MNWPYLAGFFDGEGCISLNGRSSQLILAQAGDRGRTLLEEIKGFLRKEDVISGKVSKRGPRPRTRQDIYVLSVSGRPSVKKMLSSMLPFLYMKKAQAQDTWRYLMLFPALPPAVCGGLHDRKE